MSAPASTVNSYARSSGQPRRLVLDPWIIGTVAALLLIGLIMVASASIGISEKETGARVPLLPAPAHVRARGPGCRGCRPRRADARSGTNTRSTCCAGAFLLLLVVLIPGIGYEVNGARRWIRLGFMNFQVSEAARVMLLMYVASYAVRRSDELRADFRGFMMPVGVLAAAAVLLLIEPDFGAATVLFATGLGVLFLAGARILHLLVPIVFGSVSARHARGHFALPPAPADRLPRSLGRSVRQRLPARAVADRDRPRRVARRRPRRERTEALLPARGAHGLRLRGAGGGVRLPRCRGRRRPVRACS